MNKPKQKNLMGTARKLLLFSMLLLMGFTSFASHFRYGHMTWERVAGVSGHIKFTVTQAWRTNAFSGVVPGATISTGTNLETGEHSVPIDLLVTSVNTADNWFYGTFSYVEKDYEAADDFTAFFENCCRIDSNLLNNSNGEFRISATGETDGLNDAPVSTTPPIVSMMTGMPYQVPATDPNGQALVYSLTPNGGFGTGSLQPAGLSITPAGQLTFAPGTPSGRYNTSVTIMDSEGALVQVDFLIDLTVGNTPPFFVYPPTPGNGVTLQGTPGQNMTFVVKGADNDGADVVSITATGLPSGATLSAAVPANPVQRTFSWTPLSEGLSTIDFKAVDNHGAEVHTIVKINVTTKPRFIAPSPGNNSAFCVVPGQTVNQTFTAQGTGNITLSNQSGVAIPGMTFSPALPFTAATTVSSNLTYAIPATEWGVKRLILQAQDANSYQSRDTVYYVVNNPPVITSTPVTTANAGVLYTYTLVTTDANTANGDEVELEHANLPSFLTATDNHDGTFTISGTPTSANAGQSYVITLQVEDMLGDAAGTHCGNATQSYTITVGGQDYFCSGIYGMVAEKHVHIHENNNVYGNIGVTSAKGKIDIHKNSNVPNPFFVRAAKIKVKDNSNVPNRIPSPAVVTLPPFLYNTATVTGSNLKITANGTYTGNYKDVEVKENLTNVILTGTVFNKIKIKKDSKVTLTGSVINVDDDIDMDEGSVLIFTNNAIVKVKKHVHIHDECKVNPTGKKVIFYVGYNNKDGEFHVHGKGAVVIASAYVPDGKIDVHGDKNTITYMYGYYIAEHIHSEHFVNWNTYNCAMPPSVPYRLAATAIEVPYQVIVAPNPSHGEFEFRVKSNDAFSPVTVRIVDVTGRIVAQQTANDALTPIHIGQGLSTGSYFAEVTQGTDRKVLQIVKLN